MQYGVIGILTAVLMTSANGFSEGTNPVEEKGRSPDMKTSLGAEIRLLASVWVIGSYDKAGKANMMTAAWGGICCSKPPCVTISLRKATYTYGNIMERKAFTVNIPSESYAKEADYFGMVSGRDVDKLFTTGLTPSKGDHVDAPYIKEFPLAVECKLINTVEIGSHTMFIGEIMDVKADKSILGENGNGVIPTFLFDPASRSYYKLGGCLGKAFFIGKEIADKPQKSK